MEEDSIRIETGAQLLARLMKRPSLEGLEKCLFSNGGPRENEVVEISGELSSGKTLLITQLLAKCLLPDKYKDCQLNGLGAGAVIVNTDHHFQISMLVDLMTHFIRDVKVSDDKIAADIIEDSLRNLIVLNCYDSVQFSLGLQLLQKVLSDDDKIALVIVDSISAYYWQDRGNGGFRSMDGYLKDSLKLIRKYTLKHKVVILYTRPIDFESRGKEAVDCAAAPDEDNVNYRIQLRKCEKTNGFKAVVESAIDKKTVGYSINDHGIAWRTMDNKEQN